MARSRNIFMVKMSIGCSLLLSLVVSSNSVFGQGSARGAELLFLKGQNMERSKNYKAAAGFYDEAILLNAKNSKYFAARGRIDSRLGRLDEGLSDFRKALMLDPKTDLDVTEFAKCLLSAGRFAEVVNVCTAELKRKPTSSRLYLLRSQAFSFEGNHKNAIEDLNKAIELKPGLEELYESRAKEYQSQKQYAAAILDYTKQLATDGKNARIRAFLARGRCYFELHDFKKAQADFTSCIGLQKSKSRGLAEVYGWRAKAFEKQGLQKLADEDRKSANSASEDFEI